MLPTFTPEHANMQPALVAPLREGLHEWLEQGWLGAGFGDTFPGEGWEACPVEGFELTHKGALLAAKALKLAPRVVAQRWVDALNQHPFVLEVQIAGPGHVNLKLDPASLLALLAEQGPFYPIPAQPATLIEFVSANPTGPLHLGHARQAVLGSTLANLLKEHGWLVGTEFYSNDAGAQIDMLVQSVSLRMQQQRGAVLLFERSLTDAPGGEPKGEGKFYGWDALSGPIQECLATCPRFSSGMPMGAPGQWTVAELRQFYPNALWFPKDGYHGQDIVVLATQALATQIAPSDLASIKAFAVEQIAQGQMATLARLGVHFDSLASERALHESGDVERVLEGLRHHAYRALKAQQEDSEPSAGAKPAWFLRTTIFGDDKDRVMQKHDGAVPYFIPDVAYHIDKYRRGWVRALNIQGSDHHGTLARLRAGIQFLGGPVDYPQAMFHTMVSVLKNGKPLVASKRAGTALPADQIIDMLGVDAFRMSLLSSGPGSELTVDIDAWQAQGLANPVYAVQYASARLHSMLERAAHAPAGTVCAGAYTPQQQELAKAVLMFSDRLQRAALAMDPVRPVMIVRELASLVHSAYEHSPKLVDLEPNSRKAHVALFQAALGAIQTGTQVLGVHAPERMDSLTLKTLPSESGKRAKP